jgi:hypothetical protein
LLKEFPKVQCFPVAQPDGGRDAVSYFSPDAEKSIVFQVKFVRKPLAEKEPHKWLLGHLKAELPKILQLRKKGATQYVLITNIPGTAHFGYRFDRSSERSHYPRNWNRQLLLVAR